MQPLSGIRVLELGMVMQVPLAGQMLAEYGAEVIKVERPSRGDIIRDLDEVGTAQGSMSCYYASVGCGKRSICLDLKQKEGREVLEKLIDTADVLLHNFRPGVMEHLGLGYEEVSKRNPRIVYAVGYAFGAEGPLTGMPGQDMLAQSMSGFAMNGVEPGDRPRLTATPVVDYATAVSLTQGILAALLGRERTGKGDLVTTSLFSVAVAMQGLEIASQNVYGYRTNWLQYAMTFKTLDGWIIVLTLFRDNPLQLMCEAFEEDDMSVDPELANATLQRQNAKKIQEKFEPIMMRYTTEECIDRLSKTDVLCTPILDLSQTLEHPQTLRNGLLREVDIAGHGPVKLMGSPVKLASQGEVTLRPPSALGESSAEILGELGYSDDDIKTYQDRGVIR